MTYNDQSKAQLPNPIISSDKIDCLVGGTDATLFLHDTFYGICADDVETEWAIVGRGKLQ